jgi:hypothetical protein
VSDNAFIFMLALGTTVLVGILIVAHVSAYRLKKRLQLRREAAALAPNVGGLTEPELDFSGIRYGDDDAKTVSVQVRHAETAR